MASVHSSRKRNNPYVRFVNIDRGVAWDVTNGVASATPAWGNTDMALTWNSYLGCYPITIPAGVLTIPGRWNMLFYDSATPADTDEALPESRQFIVDPCGGLSNSVPILLNP
jgi:hypothetical protein